MTLVGIDPDSNELRLPKGSPLTLIVRFISDGVYQVIPGTLRFAIFRSGIERFGANLTPGVDGTSHYATVTLDGSVSDPPAVNGATWQIGLLTIDGTAPLFFGPVFVRPAAPPSNDEDDPPISDLTWNPIEQVVLVDQRGPPGVSWPEQLFTAGLIDAPTVEALNAYNQQQTALALAAALGTISPIAPSTGIAIDGQTTVTAPDLVPHATPFWTRLWINGVMQRPTIDFTSDGTDTLHLSFALSAGDAWLVEQLQRNPT